MRNKTHGFAAFVLGALIAAALDKQPTLAAMPAGGGSPETELRRTLAAEPERGTDDARLWQVAEVRPGPLRPGAAGWAGSGTTPVETMADLPVAVDPALGSHPVLTGQSVTLDALWPCIAPVAPIFAKCASRD